MKLGDDPLEAGALLAGADERWNPCRPPVGATRGPADGARLKPCRPGDGAEFLNTGIPGPADGPMLRVEGVPIRAVRGTEIVDGVRPAGFPPRGQAIHPVERRSA